MYDVGDKVWWHQTLGGGGGSGQRPNMKTRRPATVAKVGPRNVLIHTPDRPCIRRGAHGQPVLDDRGATWVRPENLSRREDA